MLANPGTSTLHNRPNYTHIPPFSLTTHRCKLSLSPNFPRFSNSAKSNFYSLSLLLSRRKRERLFTSVNAFEETSVAHDAPQSLPQPISVKIPVGDRHVSLLICLVHFHFQFFFGFDDFIFKFMRFFLGK